MQACLQKIEQALLGDSLVFSQVPFVKPACAELLSLREELKVRDAHFTPPFCVGPLASSEPSAVISSLVFWDSPPFCRILPVCGSVDPLSCSESVHALT